MSASERPAGSDRDPSPGSELTAFLWVLAVLLGSLELTWWFFDRMFSK